MDRISGDIYINPTASAFRASSSSPSVLHFHQTLPSYARTPLRPLPVWISAQFNTGLILLKDESVRFGLPAFKILGASWATYCALAEKLSLPLTTSLADMRELIDIYEKGGEDIVLYTATDGNHGRAVARMANIIGVKAFVNVPSIMNDETKARIAHEGASVNVVDGGYDAAVRKSAQDSLENPGGILIQDTAWPGYEKVPQWIVDGYSTLLHEISSQTSLLLPQTPLPTHIIVPVGVGSLAQAVVSYIKSINNCSCFSLSCKIITVEPSTAPCLKKSLERGHIISIPTTETIMSGMNCGTVSTLAWPLLRGGVDASVTVSDDQTEDAQRLLNVNLGMGLKVGACGAATLAALAVISLDQKARKSLDIGRDSVIVLLATEGS